MKTMKTFLKLFVLIGFVSLTLTCTNFLDFQEKIGNKNIVYSIKITPYEAQSEETLVANTQKSIKGETIELTATLNEGRHVTLSTTDDVSISPMTISESDTSKTATFTMPAKNVEISAIFTDSLYSISINKNGAKVGEGLSASTEKSTKGATITLTATLPTNGRHVVLSANDGTTISPTKISTNNGTATFTMPAKDVAITASFNYDSEISKTISGTSFKLKLVPGGYTFTMGEHVESITPEVTLTKSYYLGETEVTQGLWEAVWGGWPGTGSLVPNTNYGLGADYPAYYLLWYDCVAFCNELTKADSSIADIELVYYSDASLTIPYTKADAQDKKEVYVNWNKTGYRLPTEAEWEYAARYIDGTIWNCGNHVSGDTERCISTAAGCSHTAADVARISEYAWWEGNNGTSGTPDYGTKEVGKKKPNALGLFDLSGNVWEWCWDYWYESYSLGPLSDPTGPTSGGGRVSRGGGWGGAASYLRSAGRGSDTPADRSYDIGLRLCRTAP